MDSASKITSQQANISAIMWPVYVLSFPCFFTTKPNQNDSGHIEMVRLLCIHINQFQFNGLQMEASSSTKGLGVNSGTGIILA